MIRNNWLFILLLYDYWNSSGPIHTNAFSFENAYFLMCFAYRPH